MSGLRVGDFVIRDSAKGIARVGAIGEAFVELEYFESVAEPVASSEVVTDRNYQPVTLSVGTRVYRLNPDTGVWTSGRVKANQGRKYYVHFPNAEYDIPVEGAELRVRWNRPVKDPVHVLTAGGNESAYYYNARIPLLRNLVEQRAACASVPALLSSGVEIFPHQVRAALTVLSDPVQRYLLADEVGLGKTVEAGYVIRQTLIDNPLAKITVLTPDVLRRQWRRELTSKFFTDDFLSARIKIVAHESPGKWQNWHDSDLLVVDEAHFLVQVDDPNTSPYRELRELARAVPRLLLLSATPVTSNLNTSLGLLHLLDPDLYSWDDREAFEERYHLRSELADVVYSLDADLSVLLPFTIERIRALLPHDERFEALAAEVLALLNEEGEVERPSDRDQVAVLVEQLRAHISETYRLHRRTIRHRRTHVLKDDPESDFPPYEVRGRRRPEMFAAPSGQHDAGQEALRMWRTSIYDAVLDEGRMAELENYASALAVLTSRTGGPIADLIGALRWRVTGEDDNARASGLTPAERNALAAPPVVAAETSVLTELETALVDHHAAEAVRVLVDAVLPVFRKHQRTVVFCGAGSLADELADALSKRFPGAPIHRHTRAYGAEASEEALSAWAGTGPSGSALIADDSAEDGLNLQRADAVVHLRLPWSPNNLEQRLGRVDRFPGIATATLQAARQFVLVTGGDETTIGDAWLTLLTEGYKVFDGSVSTLQDAIAEGLTGVWTRAMVDGPDGLKAAVNDVAAALNEATREIDKFDMLESIHDSAVPSLDVATAVGGFEMRWREVQKAILDYTDNSSGGIAIKRAQRTSGNLELHEFDPGRSHPHVDPRLFKTAVGGFNEEATTGTFNRSSALRVPGTRLFRLGNPFVDVLSTLIANDDRGQASAFWRIDPQHRGDPEFYLGFDFLVEADLTAAMTLIDSDLESSVNAVRRQADRILAPFTLKVWINAGSGAAVVDPRMVKWLDQPYSRQRDRNASGPALVEMISAVGGWTAFQELGSDAEAAARRYVVETAELNRRCQEAEHAALKSLAVIRAQADARKAAGKLVADNESFTVDADLVAALVRGLRSPVTKVVAVSCVIRKGLERSKQGG